MSSNHTITQHHSLYDEIAAMNPGVTINQTIYALLREHENLLAMEAKVRHNHHLYEEWKKVFEKQYSHLIRAIKAANGSQATLDWNLSHIALPRFWSVRNFSPTFIYWLLTKHLDTRI
jgi:hypothetical protein